MERFESCTQTNRAKQLREVFGSKILRLLTISVMLFSGCKDQKISDIQENLRRLSELCAHEKPSGYCNDATMKSRIKFAIEDGRIVYDTKIGNFVYKDSGEIVADNRSNAQVIRDEAEKNKEKFDKAMETLEYEPNEGMRTLIEQELHRENQVNTPQEPVTGAVKTDGSSSGGIKPSIYVPRKGKAYQRRHAGGK